LLEVVSFSRGREGVGSRGVSEPGVEAVDGDDEGNIEVELELGVGAIPRISEMAAADLVARRFAAWILARWLCGTTEC
jgi:hypothetical protein